MVVCTDSQQDLNTMKFEWTLRRGSATGTVIQANKPTTGVNASNKGECSFIVYDSGDYYVTVTATDPGGLTSVPFSMTSAKYTVSSLAPDVSGCSLSVTPDSVAEGMGTPVTVTLNGTPADVNADKAPNASFT